MRRFKWSALVGSVATLAIVSSAQGAVTIGQTGGTATCGIAAVQRPDGPGVAYTAPTAGVITSWSHQVTTLLPNASLRLKVFRRTAPMTYLTVGHSPYERLTGGLNTFATRISLAAGDVIGLRASTEGAECFRLDGGYIVDSRVLVDPEPGTVFEANQFSDSTALNLAAVVERDADRDGFGDETQDQCLTSASPPGGPCADADAPETRITKDAPKRTDNDKVKFRFTSDEAGAKFECKLKGRGLDQEVKQFNDCDSPRKYKNLDEGRFRFKVRAIDAAGNVDPTPAKDRFRVVD